jgi:hypothetical protein
MAKGFASAYGSTARAQDKSGTKRWIVRKNAEQNDEGISHFIFILKLRREREREGTLIIYGFCVKEGRGEARWLFKQLEA